MLLVYIVQFSASKVCRLDYVELEDDKSVLELLI